MKKLQRIMAIAGVVLLVGMYAATLIFALSGSPESDGLFKASIACTIIVPVFLYANMLVYKVLKSRGDTKKQMAEEDKNND
ncbi:MAG: hypothetical protein ACI4EH_10630 [Oliverpabstia sp.]